VKRHLSLLFTLITIGIVALPVYAAPAKDSDVSSSKHNLSASYDLDGSGTTTSRVCVFCHTPHGANPDASYNMPLWNRDLSGETYTLYGADAGGDSLQGTSLTTGLLGQPGGSSKLCLSCHDGTIAIGKLNVFNAGTGGTSTVGDTTIDNGSGVDTGFTRNIGINLQNDHPISFTYATAEAADDQLRTSGLGTDIDNRVPGTSNPLIPLESGQVQCTSCHDPHVVDATDPAVSVKFIRDGLNRFQENLGPLSDNSFDDTNDIICLGCHKKTGWSQSSHAVSTVANETYTAAAASLRDFPAGIPVYKAACLNCHDTHTVQGARKLLREGTDDTNNPKDGGGPAQEECFWLHYLREP